jgi:exodeoxyribonuclease VII large subunit
MVRHVIESEYRLQSIWVEGEISNVSLPASGHMYFTLKDDAASLRCVMWRPEVEKLFQIPSNGEAVEVHGTISVYEAGGQYQLYADQVRAAGEGTLFLEFMRLKSQLENEGLFDLARKRILPAFPHRIGVVTSPGAAAWQDVVNVLRRRFPLAEVVLSPASVQGEEAPSQIVAALEALNRLSNPDVILLVRGGGSMEDLWAFNTEEVVRAIAASQAPTITGVGHESDLILADFAADLRAPTPSAAAEICTPNRLDLIDDVGKHVESLSRTFSIHLHALRSEVNQALDSLSRNSPRAQVFDARQMVDELVYLLNTMMRHSMELRKTAVEGLFQTLRAVGPIAVLGRGFALVQRLDDGALVRSLKQIAPKDVLSVRVSDGTFSAKVDQVDQGDE